MSGNGFVGGGVSLTLVIRLVFIGFLSIREVGVESCYPGGEKTRRLGKVSDRRLAAIEAMTRRLDKVAPQPHHPVARRYAGSVQ